MRFSSTKEKNVTYLILWSNYGNGVVCGWIPLVNRKKISNAESVLQLS
jgi:hypothetical protein